MSLPRILTFYIKARLEPNDAEFRLAILNFMYSKVPITETQTSLRSILASDPILEAEYSSFLTHPTATQAERKAARQNLGALMKIPLYNFPPTAPSLEDTEAFFASIKVC
jgi:hypothetical protein